MDRVVDLIDNYPSEPAVSEDIFKRIGVCESIC
jgi:hypothetical protein